MKKILAVAFATMFMLASVPAFACDGHKSADKSSSDESVMTSADDGEKAEDAKTTKKKKEAKKTDEKKSEAKTEGEV